MNYFLNRIYKVLSSWKSTTKLLCTLVILGQFAIIRPAMGGNNSGMGIELLAILASLFGGGFVGPAIQPTSGCGVYASDVACPYDGGDSGGYSSDAFANVRSTGSNDLKSPFRIVPPFNRYFDSCTATAGLGTCRFVNLGIKGDPSHQARRSCHNSAQAIDVGPLTCAGGRRVLASDPLYFRVARCMANSTNNELEVIFYKTEGPNMKQRSDHNNHMHIQLKNCSMVYG